MKEKVKAFWGKANKVFSVVFINYIAIVSVMCPVFWYQSKNVSKEHDENFKQIEHRDSILTEILIKQYDRHIQSDNRYQELKFKVDSLENKITELGEDLTDIFD